MKYAIAAALLLPLAAGAQSPAGGTIPPKNAAIALKKEVLSVSRGLIRVDDEFVNESGVDVEESMVMALPAYPVAGEIQPAIHDKLIGFVNKADDKPVPYRTVVRALHDGVDITPQLRELGLSDMQMTYQSAIGNTGASDLVTARQRQQLEKLKLFGTRGQMTVPGPLWEAQISYVWRQKFPSRKVVRVHHTYQPFVGTWMRVEGATLDKETMQRYCTDAAFLKGWKKLTTAPGGSPVLAAQAVAYPLERGNRWKNGIEDLTLKLVKFEPSERISLCIPGTVDKLDAKTFQVRLQNFQPTKDLEVYFGNISSILHYVKDLD